MTTTDLRERALAHLDTAARFLRAYPDLPVPTVDVLTLESIDTVTLRITWHMTEQSHEDALEVMRAFDGWDRQVLDSCTAYRTTVGDLGITLYAATTGAAPTPPTVNLLDALPREVTA